MSEELLKALMQLFALASDVDDINEESRIIVKRFLEQELNQELVEDYIKLYDDNVEKYHQLSARKRGENIESIDLDSDQVHNICKDINDSLIQRQKVIILIRIIEYIFADGEISDHEMKFLNTVSTIFKVEQKEFDDCIAFVQSSESALASADSFLVINAKDEEKEGINKHLHSDGLEGDIIILHIESVKMLAFKYFGKADLYLNGQNIKAERAYILNQGSSIRSSKVNPIYYSDVLSRFLSDTDQTQITFTAKNTEYKFKSGKKGLQNFNFSEGSGRLVAIMGGSGAGKSTLLNVLNGNNPPSKGSVTINGIDIHSDKSKIEGVIGYVSQDDLLIEELTVFQNLYYNAKLCFDGFSNEDIKERVDKLLLSLGLAETANLKVGSPLEKTISGGQRKRLNIALELIREPAVLFLDEPTSGLSSRDSENIMDLLKELALKGKLVFVVIHQPSSDIFKMFDKLVILDVGGLPIYYGNPVDSVIYFKKYINHVNSNESECPTCGNVNPEQIFNIIESKVLDEYGNITEQRKVSANEWYEHYQTALEPELQVLKDDDSTPESTFNIPNKFKQFFVFIRRDILSKLTNKQYLLINFLEAPVLGLILSFFIKYYPTIGDTGEISPEYIFLENNNIPAYLFMAVIVALFIGLTVSAEEIIRDQKIRKRESFLNLSNGSYLFSKILIMFSLSAIQTLTFVLIGNTILEIDSGLLMDYWLALFTTACFANALGLNISAAFNSAVTIYILIPFLIIPQLIFSGVIVKFDELNPSISSSREVPFIGDIMASRWAFEALAVNQFKNNQYEKHLYPFDRDLSIANFKKIYWIPDIKAKKNFVSTYLNDEDKREDVINKLNVIKNEIIKESNETEFIEFPYLDNLEIEKIDDKTIAEINNYLEELKAYYNKMYNVVSDERDNVISNLMADESSLNFNELKFKYKNQYLTDMLQDKQSLKKYVEIDHELVQQLDPIYLDSKSFRSHFYAPRKAFFGQLYDTFVLNLSVIWGMTLLLCITLYFDLFRKIVNIF